MPALLMPLLGFLAVTAVQFVPDERLIERIQQSIARGELRTEEHETTTLGNEIGKVGDCIVLFMGLGDDEASPAWRRALESATMGPCSTGVPAIRDRLPGAPLRSTWKYFRYWHGNSVFLRPVVAMFGVPAARQIGGFFIIASLTLLVVGLTRTVGATISLALVTPLVATSEWWDLPESFSQELSVATLLATSFACMRMMDRATSLRRMVVVTATAGAAYAFVDLLSVPPGAAVLTGTVATIVYHARNPGRPRWLTSFVVSVASWFAGYGWMWFSKWVLAAMALGPADVFEYVGRRAMIRINGEDSHFVPGFGNALSLNVSRWLERPLAAVVVMATVGLVAYGALASRRFRWTGLLLSTVPLLFLAAWYEVLSNQSLLHWYFTQRSIPIMLGCICAMQLSLQRFVARENRPGAAHEN